MIFTELFVKKLPWNAQSKRIECPIRKIQTYNLMSHLSADVSKNVLWLRRYLFNWQTKTFSAVLYYKIKHNNFNNEIQTKELSKLIYFLTFSRSFLENKKTLPKQSFHANARKNICLKVVLNLNSVKDLSVWAKERRYFYFIRKNNTLFLKYLHHQMTNCIQWTIG